MCGIFGIFASESIHPDEFAVLPVMAGVLMHRGPDGGGLHEEERVGIGMRRLSIIDVHTGDQPMANEDGTIWVVFNGEIYNFRELRAELSAKGHEFSTASDTEVIVHLYEEEGERCVHRLRGMFAFAVWDRRRRRLFLARDRLGIKPLYYTQTPQGFVFGSELKAITCSPWLQRRVNLAAVRSYLRYGYVPDPLTILEDAAKLAPGHTLTVDEGRAAQPVCYWDSRTFFRASVRPEAEAAEMLGTLLADAVRSHLVSDVPLGALLSGGLDSTTIVAIMARELGIPVKTFSVGFRDRPYNELPFAREVADWFGTEHHELVVEPEDLGILEEVLSAVDEPFADASAIPTYLISKLARAHVKVVLSGDGGDEIFAGYERYVVDYRRRFVGLLGDAGLGGGLRQLSGLLPEGTPGKNYLFHLSMPRMERYLDSLSLFPIRKLHDLLDPAVAHDGRDTLGASLSASEALDPLSRLQDLDLRSYLPGDVLTKVDRMSMANSLEARVPLLDHPLVEFACGLPPDLRMRNGRTKYLLRRILKGKVPDSVLTRPKQGFAVPIEAWFSGSLSGFFQDQLNGDRSRLQEVGIRSSAIDSLIRMYASKRRQDDCWRLWTLVVLNRSLDKLSKDGRAATGK